MKNIRFCEAELAEGFWKKRYELNRDVSLACVRDRFEESGRMDALRFKYKTGDSLHFYYDSDVAKWIEAVAYLIEAGNDMHEYEEVIDALIDSMEKHRRSDGYLNSYFQQIEPENVFRDRDKHELYCAGHLMEAAIAYDRATGKGKFLRIVCDYADLIDRVFRQEKTAGFTTSGHPEIELALYKLYAYTGEKRYLLLSEYFVFERHKNVQPCRDFANNKYDQCEMSVYDLALAEGHAVRAVYLYTAMAQLAFERKDAALLEALKRLFADMKKKMYVTGGIGSASVGESFTIDYDLPNLTAYSESCAAIGLAFLCLEMQKFGLNDEYGDIIEKILYNAGLSPVSLDGKKFFYENPLEVRLKEIAKQTSVVSGSQPKLPIPERVELFWCSCCPPNLNRFYARLGDFIFGEEKDGLVVHQYIASACRGVQMETEYALDGKVRLCAAEYNFPYLYVRIPRWAKDFHVSGSAASSDFENIGGYARIPVAKTFDVVLDFGIRPRFIYADPRVCDDVGRCALVYGPIVYAAESADNGNELNSLLVNTDLTPRAVLNEKYGLYDFCADGEREEIFKDELYSETRPKRSECTIRFIPYFAFANRGKTDMLVWIRHN